MQKSLFILFGGLMAVFPSACSTVGAVSPHTLHQIVGAGPHDQAITLASLDRTKVKISPKSRLRVHVKGGSSPWVPACSLKVSSQSIKVAGKVLDWEQLDTIEVKNPDTGKTIAAVFGAVIVAAAVVGTVAAVSSKSKGKSKKRRVKSRSSRRSRGHAATRTSTRVRARAPAATRTSTHVRARAPAATRTSTHVRARAPAATRTSTRVRARAPAATRTSTRVRAPAVTTAQRSTPQPKVGRRSRPHRSRPRYATRRRPRHHHGGDIAIHIPVTVDDGIPPPPGPICEPGMPCGPPPPPPQLAQAGGVEGEAPTPPPPPPLHPLFSRRLCK